MKTISPTTSSKKKNLARLAIGAILILAALLAFLVAVRLITGKPLGLRGYVNKTIYPVTNLAKAIWNSSAVKADPQDFQNIVFLHHSTGSNLIQEGGVRQILQDAGYNFWDHGYNEQGLRRPDGRSAGYNYRIPEDDTNPNGLYEIFTQPEYPLPLNAFSGLLQHDVIITKSCFRPANHIRSDEQLEQYKKWYLEIRDEIDQHPEKIFIIMTVPPLNPAETNQEEATRARIFAQWLMSEEFLSGHPNIFAYDFFDALAENDPSSPEYNMLRADYRNGDDSHPNQAANQAIGPLFAGFVADAIEEYKNSLSE